MKKILLNISLALALGLVMKLFGKMKHTWINTSMHSIHI